MEHGDAPSITPGKKSQSQLARLKRAQAELATLDARASQPDLYIARLKVHQPDTQAGAFIKQVREARDKALAAYTTERMAVRKMKQLPRAYGYTTSLAEWARCWTRRAAAECPTVEGVTQTRFAVVESILESPSDGDTESDYTATFYDPPSGSFHSLMYDHWMRDHTHWYSVDAPDLMWVISHMGYEFPAPPCDGTLFYEGNLRLLTSSYINADSSGAFLVDLLMHESPNGGSPPATFEAYSSWVGQHVFTSTDFQSTPFPVSGSFAVVKDQQSRLWFGVATLCSAEDGIAGTNGWSYLMVAPVPGEVEPGIKWRIVP